MKTPESLTSLLEALKSEAIDSGVGLLKSSEAIVCPTVESAEDEDGIRLSGDACRLLFASPDTVERMLEALNDPEDASLMLFDLELDQNVMDALERRFISVDEG